MRGDNSLVRKKKERCSEVEVHIPMLDDDDSRTWLDSSVHRSLRLYEAAFDILLCLQLLYWAEIDVHRQSADSYIVQASSSFRP